MTLLSRQSPRIILLVSVFLSVTSSVAFSQGAEVDRARYGVSNSPSSSQADVFGTQLSGEYLIGPGDLLEISVWREPELTRQVRVRPDGRFSYPLIGTITAAGLTIEQIQDTVKSELLKYVKFPEVTISVIETTSNKVTVLGEVYYPGIYSYKGNIDVVTAIGLAGDFNEKAKRESVVIVSGNYTDHPTARRVNVFRSLRQGSAGGSFMLKPNDVVYVPKTFINDFNKTIEDMQPTLALFNSNFMTTRSNLRVLYYNRDRPIKQTNQ